MAYQSRGRDPLFDSDVQAAIEKRGKELLGIALILLAAAAAAMTLSYHPDDPSFLSATDAPVRNWTGAIGASIAAPLFMIVGWGTWGIPIILGGWGLRFTLHQGEGRALSRLIFGPIAVALASVYAASLVPGPEWSHSFGLGGLFGDTVLGTVLGILPVSASIGLKLLSLLLGLVMLGCGAFVLGFTWSELRKIARFLVVGLIVAYAGMVRLLAYGGRGAVAGVQAVNARKQAQRDQHPQEEPRMGAPAADWRVDRGPEAAPADGPRAEQAPAAKGGFLSRMPALVRRPDPLPEPELIERAPAAQVDEMPGNDRIKAKIADVIRNRVRAAPEVSAERGPADPAHMPPEPPLTSFAAAQPDDDAVLDDDAREDMETPEWPAAAPHSIPVAEPRKVVQHAARKPVQPSTRAKAEAQPALQFEETGAEFELPPLNLLSNPATIQRHHLSDEALEENARMLETVLDDYGVKGEIVSVRPGPVVTMYELEPAPGLKASRVIGLADDIARSMSALSARVSTVPGRSVIGIELPNENREKVVLREILSARDYGDSNMKLPLALGKDIGGDPIVANLSKMPHLLIAGTTGSGKSVAINTMILSLLYRLTPDECRLIMIDPKMLELSVYDGIPHLLSPVVTDPKKAVVALKWVVGEMEERYRKMSKMGVRNIDGYNSRVADALAKGEMFSRTVQTGFDDETGEPVFETEEFAPEKMPYIVVIVDEMADLMMVAGKEIEACIQRLAQMARASGIHLIMATQRPSVDVITGTIKANFPTRISFQVTSKIDSRTILGEMGAEQLLGMGDMLYMAGGARITRCHGPFVSDEEVEEIVRYLKSFGPPDYVGGVVEGPDEDREGSIDQVLGLGGNTDTEDALYDTAVAIVVKDRKCSTSYIQRKLAIGYNKAARLVEQMEEQGVVSGANHVGKREILVPEQ
ncbi:MAG: DNA translocase FtsK [Sediminimonas sp.]|uniref:DNA translocase FtsK n=1 Tax=Sediminimonas sp. TaxID=2823379 RepID=UPI0028709C8E|nr:DNA translocase FtsK [Sediminimonas sp.]MDR9486338.1 DNA translocase FtsK [Sediminimonas sp.]